MGLESVVDEHNRTLRAAATAVTGVTITPQLIRRAVKAGCAPLLGVLLALSGCGEDTVAQRTASVTAGVQTEVAAPAPSQAASVVVYKSASCGCCTKWADYLTANGFIVETRDSEDLAAIKQRLGVPHGLRSCHTATIGSHVVEGHVPVEDIRRFIASEPAGVLAVPGMPAGSPGMEHPTISTAYDAFLVRPSGEVSTFAHHPARLTE